jgi:uncharacterized protein (TIGR03435 family)
MKEMMLMVQSLLASRLAMKAHFETRERPAFILTVAKGGPKLHFVNSEDCVPRNPTKANPPEGLNYCGNNLVSRDGAWRATHINMKGVTGILSRRLRGPVIDRTGIKGTFDIELQWADNSPAANPDDPPPSISAIVKENLGLELKAGRGPVEVLVIDHIERPTGN